MESVDDSSALQNDLDKLSAWIPCWKVIHVPGSKKTVKTDYGLHGQVLESVPCYRYLGFDISSDLTWNSYVDRVTANTNSDS